MGLFTKVFRGLGNSFSAFSQPLMQQQYQYNLQLQQQNQNWQEEMSNTAHQREVKDLIAAGINPVYTANGGGGASFGSVGTGTVSNAQLPQFNPVATVLSAIQSRNQTNATNADNALKASYAQHEIIKMGETKAKILNLLEDTSLKGSQRKVFEKQLSEIDANIHYLNSHAKALLSNAQTNKMSQLDKMIDNAQYIEFARKHSKWYRFQQDAKHYFKGFAK